MNTLHASPVRRHAVRDHFASGVGFSIAIALCTIACSKDEPSKSNPDQTTAGMPVDSSGTGGMTPTTAGGAGAIATTQGGAGASAPSAGRGARSSAGGAGAPASGGAGAVATSGRGGTGGMPAAGSGGMQAGGATGTVDTGACTRELLKSTVDSYFAALAAHDPK